ncbi:MAG: MarR family transcriptional regulator [Halobacteriales archaeon]|nr:MarR family transcriptional regulator [Halobacteriales archaeon]
MTRPRDAVLAAVRAAPGASLAEVARAAGVAHSVAKYHVDRLEAAGLVRTERRGKRRHCVATGACASPRALAGSPGARLVLARLDDLGQAAPLRDVAQGLPMGKTGVRWHLDRLARAGLVDRQGAPGRVRYRSTGACGP